MFRLSNNTDLPEASAFSVKSFWLMLVTVLLTAVNALGFDLAGSLCEVGLGCSADEIASRGEHAVGLIQQLLPILTAIWMWFERRAPNLRLVFWRRSSPSRLETLPHSLGQTGVVAILGLCLLLLSAPAARAMICAPPEDVSVRLGGKYREVIVARALDDRGRPVLLYVNPDTGTWSMIVLLDGRACLSASGEGWRAAPPGEAA